MTRRAVQPTGSAVTERPRGRQDNAGRRMQGDIDTTGTVVDKQYTILSQIGMNMVFWESLIKQKPADLD